MTDRRWCGECVPVPISTSIPLLGHDRYNDSVLTAFGSRARHSAPRHSWSCCTEAIEHHHPILLIHIMEVLEVQTSQLVILCCSDVAAWDLVDDEEQDDGDDERPDRACACRSKLIAHLFPIPVPPTAFVRIVHAVHCWHVIGSKETSQDVANETADSVNSEDVEAFVDSQQVLVPNSEEGSTCRQRADQRCNIDGNEACGGRDADQTSDDAGAETDDGEFPNEDVLKKYPR